MRNKLFLTTADIMVLTNLSRKKAQQIKADVNRIAIERGMRIVSTKLCSADLFEELFMKSTIGKHDDAC